MPVVKGQGRSALMSATQEIYHSGPLPPAETLEHYERIVPGAAERILSMAEKEQANRHDNECKITETLAVDCQADRTESFRKDIIAFLVFLVCMASGLYLITHGYSTKIAGSLMGAPLLVAIGVFVYHRNTGRAGLTRTDKQR